MRGINDVFDGPMRIEQSSICALGLCRIETTRRVNEVSDLPFRVCLNSALRCVACMAWLGLAPIVVT